MLFVVVVVVVVGLFLFHRVLFGGVSKLVFYAQSTGAVISGRYFGGIVVEIEISSNGGMVLVLLSSLARRDCNFTPHSFTQYLRLSI